MSAGELRHRLVLEERVATPDGLGGETESWLEIGRPWGRIEPASGAERLVGDQLEARVTHNITVRYRAGVTPAHRLRMDTRVFEVLSVTNRFERSAWLECQCREIFRR